MTSIGEPGPCGETVSWESCLDYVDSIPDATWELAAILNQVASRVGHGDGLRRNDE